MISLCMVVRNNGSILRRAIQSVRGLVNEIVIIDQDSTDNTEKIARDCADIYVKKRMKGNADPDREYCSSLARGEWLLWLDGDEYLSSPLQKQIPKLAVDGSYDVFWIRFRNLIDKVDIHSILGDDWHPRLYKKGALVWSPEAHVHPKINSPLQAWVEQPIVHDRDWKKALAVHEIRSQHIRPEARELEENFVKSVEDLLRHEKKTKK